MRKWVCYLSKIIGVVMIVAGLLGIKLEGVGIWLYMGIDVSLIIISDVLFMKGEVHEIVVGSIDGHGDLLMVRISDVGGNEYRVTQFMADRFELGRKYKVRCTFSGEIMKILEE